MDGPLVTQTRPEKRIARHLPNLISCLRIALVAPLIATVLTKHFVAALWIAFAAGVSDALDGLLARRFGWQSRLGTLLDPLADKLLLVAAYLALAWGGHLPWPLAWLVLARDLTIVLGAFAYQQIIGGFEARPSLLSKATTFVQIVYVLLVLSAVAFAWQMPVRWLLPWLVAVFTLASGFDYLLRWSLRARRAARAREASR
ncbi:MAG: CDP-alcohol phosphatidyltransferase family protein [Rhodanobacteraceae bacterium]